MKGTLASELRTRLCPTRFTYSEMMGSSRILDCFMTSVANWWPRAISFWMEYRLRQLPTFRSPIWDGSSLEFFWPAGMAVDASASASTAAERNFIDASWGPFHLL